MNIAPVPANEQERLKALSEYAVLDATPDEDLDSITSIAAAICDAPYSLLSISHPGRQGYRSQHGIKLSVTSSIDAICLHTAHGSNELVVIADLAKDKRFRNDPLVTRKPHAVFYAGVQLVNADGNVLGTLCVLDNKARTLTAKQSKMLRSLGRQVVALLEVGWKNKQLKQKDAELCATIGDLEKIVHLASHDLKSPLNNIISLTHLLKDEHAKRLDEEGNEYITFLNAAAYQLSDLVSGIVTYSRTAQQPLEAKEDIDVSALLKEVCGLINIPEHATVKYKKGMGTVHASRSALKQILLQLIHNGIQYNDSKAVKVEVLFNCGNNVYTFDVKDNGPGIAEQDREKIFNLFERLHMNVKDGESMGIGLAIAKRLIEKMGGRLSLDTKAGKGSTFSFAIPK